MTRLSLPTLLSKVAFSTTIPFTTLLLVSLIGSLNAYAQTSPITARSVLVQAEDYVAFSDSDTGNNGGAFRQDDVDIEATSDAGGGFNVGWIIDGETLDYEVELGAGEYNLFTRVASPFNSGAYTLSIDGNQIGSDSVDATGGFQNFDTRRAGSIRIDNGGTYTCLLYTSPSPRD